MPVGKLTNLRAASPYRYQSSAGRRACINLSSRAYCQSTQFEPRRRAGFASDYAEHFAECCDPKRPAAAICYCRKQREALTRRHRRLLGYEVHCTDTRRGVT